MAECLYPTFKPWCYIWHQSTPRGSGDNNRGINATVIGGWQLAVPKNSNHTLEAVEFIRYATSEEVQAWRARKVGYIPTTRNHEEDKLVIGVNQNTKEFTRHFSENQSRCFSTAVHSVLANRLAKADNAVEVAIGKIEDCGIILK